MKKCTVTEVTCLLSQARVTDARLSNGSSLFVLSNELLMKPNATGIIRPALKIHIGGSQANVGAGYDLAKLSELAGLGQAAPENE